MKRVFISYRHAADGEFSGKLFDRLGQSLGVNGVFFDAASISAGADFREKMCSEMLRCDVILVVIGEHWLNIELNGRRRLEMVDDPVRIEIECALETSALLIPVLVNQAEMPRYEQLPKSIGQLAFRNAQRIQEREFEAGVAQLLRTIEALRRPQRSIRRLRFITAILSFIAFLLGTQLYQALLARNFLQSTAGLASELHRRDPTLFAGNTDLQSQAVSRVFANRLALDQATSLKEMLLQTQQSFDLFVLSGKSLAECETAFASAIQRGARIRIVLIDHSESNRDSVMHFADVVSDSQRSFEWYTDNYQSTLGILRRIAHAQVANTAGTFEVRAFDGPFANSFWVKDAGMTGHQAAHVAITMYGDDREFPCARFGALAPPVIQQLRQRFDVLWNRAKPVGG